MVLGSTGYLDSFRAHPAVDVAGLLERHGLSWYRRPLGRFGGALISFGNEYSVLTNSTLPPTDQRLVAAHELGHYLMHRGQAQLFLCDVADAGTQERQAGRFAAELLMPIQMLYWFHRRGFEAPSEVARILGVSVEAAGARMVELGLGSTEAVGEGIGGGVFNLGAGEASR